jgi:hypothetical protein
MFTLLIDASGNTCIVTVNGLEVHPPGTFGVTEYVAVCRVLVVLNKVPDTTEEAVLKAPPVIKPVTVGALQEYVVPEGIVPVKAAVKLAPEQILKVTLFTAANGNTDTTPVNTSPVQPEESGVIVYVAV